MSKNKLIAILTSVVLIGGMVECTTLIHTIVNQNTTKIVNKVLLTAPSLKNLAVVINTQKNPLVLYSNTSYNSNISSYISVGEMLNYQKTDNPDFYKVTVQETGATGYISATNIQIIESGINQAYNSVDKAGIIINVSTDVKLMSSPDINSQIWGSYRDNTNINILGKQGQWYKVEAGTQVGYMYQSYVGITNENISNIKNLENQNNNANSQEKIKTQTLSNKQSNTNEDINQLYVTLADASNMNSLPGSYLVGNLNLATKINGENYYYMYTGEVEAWNMGGYPESIMWNNIDSSQLTAYGYVNTSGKVIKNVAPTAIIDQFNKLSDSQKIAQLKEISSEYLANKVQYVLNQSENTKYKVNIPNFDVNLNNYITMNGQKLYAVSFEISKNNGFKNKEVTMYVGGDGFVHLQNLQDFAKIFTDKQIYINWEQYKVKTQ